MTRAAWLIALAITACGAPREPIRMSSAGDVTRDRTGGADTRRSEEGAAPSGPPPSWLWEVTREGSQPSYVLGTMHLGVLFGRALPPPLDEHLYDARAVVMEVDPRDVQRMIASAPRTRRRVSRSAQLDRALPAATWLALVAELGGLAPPELLRMLPPGLLVHHLHQVRMAEVEAIEDGRQPVRGAASTVRLDMSIFEWAVASGRPVVPLETPDEVFTALGSLPQGDALEALRAIVDDAEAARAASARLRTAYLTMDAAAIVAIVEEAGPEFNAVMLTGRNRAWMSRLVPELERGDAFVAVGLAHLIGPDSLLGMLTERGLTVRRIGGTEPAPSDGEHE